MSRNSDAQLNCQNQICRSLRKKVESLCKIVEAAQSLINDILPIINDCQPNIKNTQRLSSESDPNPASLNGDDDTQSNSDDGNIEDIEEDGAKDDGSRHSGDGSASRKNYCPHANCVGNPQYTQGRSLRRHYTSHVECNEACIFCGYVSTMVRDYVLHFGKCKERRDRDEKAMETAKMKRDELCKRARDALKKMSELGAKSGGTAVELEDKGEKRKADDAAPPSQRRRRTDISAPDSCASFALAGVTANTAEDSTSRPFNEYAPWNVYEEAFRNSELPKSLVTNNELFQQYTESPLRGTVFSSDCTMDWNIDYVNGLQCTSEQTSLFNTSIADSFAGIVPANGECVGQTSVKDCNTGPMASYEDAIDR